MGDRWWKVSEETYSAFVADSASSESVLLTALNANSYKDNQRAMVVFEYIFGVLTNCSESGYSYEQTNELLSIHQKIFTTFITSAASGGEQYGTREEAIELFKTDIKPLTSASLFTVEQCTNIAQFFAISFIRNFDAYQYALSNLPRELINTKLLCVQTPHSLPSLSDAGTLDGASTIA